MKNIFKVLCFVALATIFAGCPKDDSEDTFVVKTYAEQFPIDEAAIQDFLETHYYDSSEDELKDLVAGQVALKDNPNLQFETVEIDDLSYKLYYLVIDEGDLTEGINPIEIDSAFISYKGTLLDGTTFDSSTTPIWFELDEVIAGWSKIIPKFKTGKTELSSSGDGTVTYSNYGQGIMIIPSAFGYFSSAVGSIPSYSPLVFRFNLYNQRYRDHDRDEILSIYEYFDENGDVLDTDGDDIPNYSDFDDDGDGYLTKSEIKFTYQDGTTTKTGYYPFNGALVDNPATLYDETKGIPNCSGDYFSSTRLRKHLDSSCY